MIIIRGMQKLWLLPLVLVAATAVLPAQTPSPRGAFTLDQVLNYPFPDNLVAPHDEETEGLLRVRSDVIVVIPEPLGE